MSHMDETIFSVDDTIFLVDETMSHMDENIFSVDENMCFVDETIFFVDEKRARTITGGWGRICFFFLPSLMKSGRLQGAERFGF